MVDLPDCREQLRSTLSDEDLRNSFCHASGTMPNSSAKATRSRASFRSSLSTTIGNPLDGPQNGFLCDCASFLGAPGDCQPRPPPQLEKLVRASLVCARGVCARPGSSDQIVLLCSGDLACRLSLQDARLW